jgi:hypothetical protein
MIDFTPDVAGARAIVRDNPLPAREEIWLLGSVADGLDRGYYGTPAPYTAERLRVVAEKLEQGDKDATERLAQAGEKAAEAQWASEMWHWQYDQLRSDYELLDLENGELTGELERARIDRNSAVEAFFQASVKLQQSQKYIREVRDFLNAAIEDLESGAEDELDLEVDFIFVAAGEGGLPPDLYSDLALALSDLNGETESE